MTLMAPKLILCDKGITIPDWWGPLGPILGHFGSHFGVILGTRARLLGLFGAYFSPVWLPKMTLMAPKLILWDKGITILDWWGSLGPILE